MWNKIIKKKVRIEDLEIAGTNRHRKESFRAAMQITNIGYPDNREEFNELISQYIRQLIGPEIYDTYYNQELDSTNVEQVFRVFRKYITGV